MFNAKLEAEKIVDFIREIFAERPTFLGAVIGISGGKDSLICAELCVRALGTGRVFGVLMPNGEQSDIHDALVTVKHLGIESTTVNIGEAYAAMVNAIPGDLMPTTLQNIPPRLRMTTLYAIAQHKRLLVCGTTNLSEITIGYTTKWGDSVGDFAPLAHLTKSEVVEIGVSLGLPLDLVHKAPADGLSGMTDEESFGFSYLELDEYIRNALESVSPEQAVKIEKRIAANMHKRLPIPTVR
jgi:NAD+ synthase